MDSRVIKSFIFASLIGVGTIAWAGPVEEIAALATERNKAFEQGNIDGFTEAFAENAIVTPSFQGYRVEGKPAIKQFFADMFQNYPKRRFSGRQSNNRVYNDDLMASDSYGILRLTDEQGKSTAQPLRVTLTWAKLNGRWQVVEQHLSRIPAPE